MTPTKYHYDESGRMTPESFQHMKDRMMIAPYMAKIDTEIDRWMLEQRMLDEHADSIRRFKYSDARRDFWLVLSYSPAERFEQHTKRPADIQRMIEEIRASDGFETIPSERDAEIGFGPYDGNDDKYLVMVLDYAGANFADDETGSTEWYVHVLRFGRAILMTDDRGFRHVSIFDNDEGAVEFFNVAKKEYSDWASDEDDDPDMADLIADPSLSDDARNTLRQHADEVGEVADDDGDVDDKHDDPDSYRGPDGVLGNDFDDKGW